MSSFIRLRKTLPHDPALKRLAEALGIATEVALGMLVRLAVWAADHAPGGIAPVSMSYLDEIVGQPGLAAALANLGWLEARLHEVAIAPFWEDGGRPRKSRLRRADSLAQGERLAQEIPPRLNTPAFQQLWQEWLAHRKALRAPLTKHSAKRQLAKLCEWGLRRAIAALEHSLEKGYRGVFEPASRTQQQTQQEQSQRQQAEQDEETRTAALIRRNHEQLARQREEEERLRQDREAADEQTSLRQLATRKERGQS